MYQRGRHYYADFYAGGRRIRKKLATDLDAAKQILIELRSRAEKADYGLLDNDFPLDRLREQYLRHCQQALGEVSELRYRKALDVILPRLPAKQVRQLSVGVILNYRQERLGDGVCPGTVNDEVGALHRMLRWGARHKIIGSSPLDGLKPLPHLRPKDGRALDPAEVKALLDVSPERWRNVWYAYLVTGMRLRQLLRLTFEDIDWESREIVVRAHKAKGRRERRIPIDDGLWDILKQLEASRAARKPCGRFAFGRPLCECFSDRHVFVSRACTAMATSSPNNSLMKSCARAGIPTRTFDSEGQLLEHVDVHSLCRTFATELIVNGADPKSVQELLGHKTLAMTMMLYAKVRPQNKRQAMARLSYGQGAQTPSHMLQYPGHQAPDADTVPFGHQTVTGREAKA
jgi:integrase